jgi:transposase
MSRYDMTNFEWCVIEPLLPNKPRGAPRVDDRRVLNGIFWVLRSGAPWRDLPERYGPGTTCYNRFVRWRKAGAWDRLMDAISAAPDGTIQMIDRTSIRAHQQAATAKSGSADQCLGRSRGGLTTKIHVVVDAQGLPIRLGLTAGQAHDGQIADTLLDHLGPHTIVLADKAYDADRVRELIQHQGATPNISPKKNRRWKPWLQQAPLSRAQPDRALLLQAEAFPPGRYPLRQARRQLPRHGPTRFNTALAPYL